MRKQGTKAGRLINVLMKDGKPRRVLRHRAEQLLDSGQALRYISNTVYRALKAGLEVKDLSTKDLDGKLKAKIVASRAPAAAKNEAPKSSEDGAGERRNAKSRSKVRKKSNNK